MCGGAKLAAVWPQLHMLLKGQEPACSSHEQKRTDGRQSGSKVFRWREASECSRVDVFPTLIAGPNREVSWELQEVVEMNIDKEFMAESTEIFSVSVCACEVWRVGVTSLKKKPSRFPPSKTWGLVKQTVDWVLVQKGLVWCKRFPP